MKLIKYYLLFMVLAIQINAQVLEPHTIDIYPIENVAIEKKTDGTSIVYSSEAIYNVGKSTDQNNITREYRSYYTFSLASIDHTFPTTINKVTITYFTGSSVSSFQLKNLSTVSYSTSEGGYNTIGSGTSIGAS